MSVLCLSVVITWEHPFIQNYKHSFELLVSAVAIVLFLA